MIHIPVMLNEVLSLIKPSSTTVMLDCTFGIGGHTKAILKNNAIVHAIDRDPAAIYRGRNLEKTCSRFNIHWSLFSEMSKFIPQRSCNSALFDFGICSTQLINDNISLSFTSNSKLNMNMGRSNLNAYDFINYSSAEEMARVFYEYGEEPMSNKVAIKIAERRKHKKFGTNAELANFITSIIPKKSRIHPATKIFQAIRIHVNNELGEIRSGLQNVLQLCKSGSIIIAISFHSLEDRIVKNFFKPFPYHSKVIFPSHSETMRNPRARSAKLRWLRLP